MASEQASATTPAVKTEPEVKAEPTEDLKVTDIPAASKPAPDQLDGAGAPNNGNELADTNYKVEVKLADLQADPDNPLYSVTRFEDLKL